MIEIVIDGVVIMPEASDPEAAHDELWHSFVRFLESRGWSFGGGTYPYRSDADADAPHIEV